MNILIDMLLGFFGGCIITVVIFSLLAMLSKIHTKMIHPHLAEAIQYNKKSKK